MKKKIASYLSCLLFLGGCASSNPTGNSINLKDVANEIVSKGSFDSSLVELNEDEIKSFYFYEAGLVEEAIVYISTQTTADEVALFKTDKVEEVKKAIVERVQNQVSTFGSYFPEENPKLENAVILVKNDIVIFVASKDPKQIQEMIEKLFK